MPGRASALDYSARPIRLIVGYSPGITPDVIARLVAQPLSDRLGQQVIVENKPGAGTNIAAAMAARAPSDGHTLFALNITNAVNATLYRDLSFDLVRDFAPVASTDQAPLIAVVNPSFPAKTIEDLVAMAKAAPGKINYASSGYGTASHMAGELFKISAGIDLAHVPYRNSYVPDLLAGQVPVTFTPWATIAGLVADGKLRALAVTSAKRSPTLPAIPAAAEFVPGYDYTVWHGIAAPKGAPPDIIDRLNAAINGCLADPKLIARFADLDIRTLIGSPAEFGQLITDETEKWAKVVKLAGLKAE
jgi:tripartite-type tricarboxylate transporter receptor subunit TctC